MVRRASLLAAVAAIRLVSAAPASAEDKATCVRVYESAQHLRRSAMLLEARDALVACELACPVRLRADCTQWLEDTESRTPTITIDARDAQGRPVTPRVFLDDRPIPADAHAISINPGDHALRFEFDGSPPVVQLQHLILKEGEKNRLVTVRPEPPALPKTEPAPAVTPASATGPQPAAEPPSPEPARSPAAPKTASGPLESFAAAPRISLLAGGVAVLGLAATTYFAIERANAIGSLDGCKPSKTCTTGDVQSANLDLYLGAASLVLTLGSGAFAAHTYLSRPAASGSSASPQASARLPFDLAVGPLSGGAFAALRVPVP